VVGCLILRHAGDGRAPFSAANPLQRRGRGGVRRSGGRWYPACGRGKPWPSGRRPQPGGSGIRLAV